jgi:cobalamin biosynthesis protein CobD/CbiB
MILVRHNTANSALGSANGLVQFAMCVSRAISPAFISSVFALSMEHKLVGGYLWVGIMVFICLAGTSLTLRIPDVSK